MKKVSNEMIGKIALKMGTGHTAGRQGEVIGISTLANQVHIKWTKNVQRPEEKVNVKTWCSLNSISLY